MVNYKDLWKGAIAVYLLALVFLNLYGLGGDALSQNVKKKVKLSLRLTN
jgi:hypothetical protein